MDSLDNEVRGSSQALPAMDEKIAYFKMSFGGWESYPTNLDTYDPMIANGEYYNKHLRELSTTLFCNPPSSTRVDVIDVYGEIKRNSHKLGL